MTAIFSSLTFEFEDFFFCGLLSLQHKTLDLWYTFTVIVDLEKRLKLLLMNRKYYLTDITRERQPFDLKT